MEPIHSSGPHGKSAVLIAGNTDTPSKALVLIHGRGASAESIMHLTDSLALSDEYIVIAPQAQNHVWYPERFIVPTTQNQPDLDSALEKISAIVRSLNKRYHLPSEHIVFAGFSQGACLVSEFMKRNPSQYKGAAILSGGLIGDDTEVTTFTGGDLKQTPVYLGCDEADFHIPADRVKQTAQLLEQLNAQVETKLYQGLGHAVHPDGIEFLQKLTT